MTEIPQFRQCRVSYLHFV